MTHHLRPGLTDAVHDADDAHNHVLGRPIKRPPPTMREILNSPPGPIYDTGGPFFAPGGVFIAPSGSTDPADFQPLGFPSTDGISLDHEDSVTHVPDTVTETVTATLHESGNLLALFFGVDRWLIFQGEHSGLWWSIPDDDRCDGGLFDTQAAAVDFAIEKASTA